MNGDIVLTRGTSMEKQQHIKALLERLRHFGQDYKHPDFLMTDNDDPDYQCQFCHEIGLFPIGNGGIPHTAECAIGLSHRITDISEFFNQLALKSILHQLATVEEWPMTLVGQKWVLYCPFCDQLMPDGQGTHHASCEILLAKYGQLC